MNYFESVGVELASAIDRATIEQSSISLETYVERLKEIEEAFVSKVLGDSTMRIEVLRRVAEAVFLAHLAKKATPELCESRFHGLRELGFSSRDRELTYHIIYSRHCLLTNNISTGIAVLEPLVHELGESGFVNTNEITGSDVVIAAELLSELRHRRGLL